MTLLADRGFEHGALFRWLSKHHWHCCIRVKTDLQVTLPSERILSVSDLLAPKGEVYLFHEVTVLGDVKAHLATADDTTAREPWAVLSDVPISLHTFEHYGQRFGGIEPHFTDLVFFTTKGGGTEMDITAAEVMQICNSTSQSVIYAELLV